MKARTVAQVVLTVGFIVVGSFVITRGEENSDLVRGRAGVAQLSDDPATRIAARDAQRHTYSGIVVGGVVFAAIVAVWAAPALLRRRGERRGMWGTIGLLALGGPLLLTACVDTEGTRTRVYTIQPNETAYLIAAEETSQQGTFQSEQYLMQKRVAARQVAITYSRYTVLERTGIGQRNERGYKPDTFLYLVDRTPITREWTQEATTGTSGSNQAFKLETQEAIDFWLGATCSGEVREADAAKFLYNFAGTALEPVKDEKFRDVPESVYRSASIAAVMDKNVRGAFLARLFTDFHALTINDARVKAGPVIAAAAKDITADFAAKGLTLTNCGGQGGLTFTDPKVQDSINQSFAQQQENQRKQAAAESQRIEAENQVKAQAAINEKKRLEAEGEAQATRIRQEQELAYQKQLAELLQRNPELVQYALAQKWNGQPPQYVGGNAPAPYVQVPPPAATAAPKS